MNYIWFLYIDLKNRLLFLEIILKAVIIFIVGVLDDMSEGDNADVVINSIREGIRQSLPVEGMTETEHVVIPKHGPVCILIYVYFRLKTGVNS